MARDPNSSDNDSIPNQVGDLGLSRLSDIASESRPSAEERELRRKAKIARKGIDIYDSLGDVARQYEPIQKLHKRNINTISSAEPRIRIAVEARQQRLTAQAVNAIGKEYSEQNISSMINEISSSPEAQQGALKMMNAPYSDLVGEQRSRMARLQQLGEANRGMASRVIGRQGLNQDAYGSIQANTREAQGLINELGTIGAALGQQKSLGLDPKSRAAGLMQDVARAQGTSETDRTYGAAQSLIKAFEQLSEVTDITSKEFKDLQKTTDEARKNFAAAGGGSGGNLITALGIASGGFNVAAGAAQAIMVNQRLAQAQNATGLADIENQKYQTYKAAAGGDIASLMQLSQFSGAEGFGGSVGLGARVAVGAQQIAGYLQIAQGGAQLANPVSDAMDSGAAGINNVVGGVASSTVAAFDTSRRVSENQARIAAIRARLEVSRAVNAIGAEQVQGFRDFSVGMGSAAIGLGGGGEEFLNRSISNVNLSRMASARISPEQMSQMAQMGISSMGSMFNENMAFNARTNEQRGLGSMQENLQRMSTLAAAGSNNPTSSLGAITEGAVARGLDSSKALNAVVDHTASMAASSTGRAFGLDTSAAAATLLMSGINKDTPNKEAALERAASLQDVFGKVGTNASTSYAGMVNTARIGRSTGLGGISSVLASQIDDSTLMSLNNENASRILSGAGIDVRGKNAPAMAEKLKEDRQMQLLEAGNLSVNFNRGDTLKRLRSGTALTEEEELGINQSAGLLGMRTNQKITGQDLKNRILGITSPVVQEAFGPANVDDKSTRASLDKLRSAGFEQLSTAASTAATNLGGAANAIKTLTIAIESLSKEMPSIEKNATTAAGRSAAGDKGMSVDVTKFNTAIDKLDKVLTNALSRSGLGVGSTDKQRTKAPGP